ncbi:hypothetical protein BD410DRAFT_539734 [Rickenella mellea]|uniref:Uncharacterized protein n=1 Tax=Rickenella mellea TaxID=50990 RepID=A0A4Y7PRN6_9AGAM|nr:hypothetical protein BD410DRAFT_539734 [Rickenella mellea]
MPSAICYCAITSEQIHSVHSAKPPFPAANLQIIPEMREQKGYIPGKIGRMQHISRQNGALPALDKLWHHAGPAGPDFPPLFERALWQQMLAKSQFPVNQHMK